MLDYITIEQKCPHCEDGLTEWSCSKCNGSGEGMSSLSRRCSECHGAGSRKVSCDECNGSGLIEVEVEVPRYV